MCRSTVSTSGQFLALPTADRRHDYRPAHLEDGPSTHWKIGCSCRSDTVAIIPNHRRPSITLLSSMCQILEPNKVAEITSGSQRAPTCV